MTTSTHIREVATRYPSSIACASPAIHEKIRRQDEFVAPQPVAMHPGLVLEVRIDC